MSFDKPKILDFLDGVLDDKIKQALLTEVDYRMWDALVMVGRTTKDDLATYTKTQRIREILQGQIRQLRYLIEQVEKDEFSI